MDGGDFERMKQERECYVSLPEYAMGHTAGRFDGSRGADRTKLLEELGRQDYFGLETVLPERLLTAGSKDVIYFHREDVPVLDRCLEEFFAGYGLSAKEKVQELREQADCRPMSKRFLAEYQKRYEREHQITPSFTEFAGLVMSLPDVAAAQEEDVLAAVQGARTVAARDLLIDFLNQSREWLVDEHQPVHYPALEIQRKQSQSISAYPDEVYLQIVRCLFNADYIEEHQMVEKALQTPLYAELWLYLSLFYVCGWRAQDVCRGWQYPHLAGRELPGIIRETLGEDILQDSLSYDVYEQVCDYALGAVEASGAVPSKTAREAPPPLRISIPAELKTFYGMLTLIGEADVLRTGRGYMDAARCSKYQNRINLRRFFGEPMVKALGGENIESRRLNKDYLQGLEEAGRRSGLGGLRTSMIASYARSHADLQTIRVYLQDHTLSGENAQEVLYFMAQRGVFGFLWYHALAIGHEQEMQELSMAEQNRLIAMLQSPSVTALQLEESLSEVNAQELMRQHFKKGNSRVVLQAMKTMLEISQGRGQGKEPGVYCTLRAQHFACVHAQWQSCLANACPYLVFTRQGYLPLLRVLADYQRAERQGDQRASAILHKVLIPRFREILQQLMRETRMSREEMQGLQTLLRRELEG